MWGSVLNFECSQSCWGYCGFCLCLVQGRGAAGSCPALALAAISLLSQSLDGESTLSIWDAMRPSFLVYSSWQAKPCVMHGRGWERSLGSGTEAEPPAPRVWVWDGRVGSLCATSRLLGELLHVSWTVVLVAVHWVWWSLCSVLLGIYLKSQELLCLRGQQFDKKHNFRPHAKPVWICMVLLAFCRFIKLCSCSYSCFDFRHFQCRLHTNWMWKRTIID